MKPENTSQLHFAAYEICLGEKYDMDNRGLFIIRMKYYFMNELIIRQPKLEDENNFILAMLV